MHLLCTILGPCSSYSCLLINNLEKEDIDAKMEPPIQAEYFLSGGAITFILVEEVASIDNSFCKRSLKPEIQGEWV